MISKNIFENIVEYLTLVYKRVDNQVTSYNVINEFVVTGNTVAETHVMYNLKQYTENCRGIVDNFLLVLNLHIVRRFGDINIWLSDNSIKVTETYAENSDRLGYTIDPNNIQL